MQSAYSLRAIERVLSRIGLSGILVLTLSFATPSYAQIPVWATGAGSSGSDQGRAIAIDKDGNAIVVGRFAGTAVFGTGSAQTTLTADGDADLFVAKLRKEDGNLIWIRQAGGALATTVGWGIGVANSGDSVVTGTFSRSVLFGAGEANETTLTAPVGAIQMFVAMFAKDGSLIWARRAGGSSGTSASGIAVDNAGNSVVTGGFFASATFGPGEESETTLTAAETDIFVARYGKDGSLQWARRDGGASIDSGSGVALNGDGSSIATGLFGGTITFGTTTLTASGQSDAFVVKYDKMGAVVWAASVNGPSTDQGRGVAISKDGSIVVTGITVGLTGNAADIFVGKWTSSGVPVWSRVVTGPSVDEESAIAVDSMGNSLVTGRFSFTTVFGGGETNETTLTSAGDFDIFVAKYAASGSLVWAFGAPAPGDQLGVTPPDSGLGIAVDRKGAIFVTGQFQSVVSFGATTLNSVGELDMFATKLTD